MKTQVKIQPAPFKPVEVTITLESQKQVDALAALFNFTPVTDTMLDKYGMNVYKIAQDLVGFADADSNVVDLARYLKQHTIFKKGA